MYGMKVLVFLLVTHLSSRLMVGTMVRFHCDFYWRQCAYHHQKSFKQMLHSNRGFFLAFFSTCSSYVPMDLFGCWKESKSGHCRS